MTVAVVQNDSVGGVSSNKQGLHSHAQRGNEWGAFRMTRGVAVVQNDKGWEVQNHSGEFVLFELY